MRSGCECLVGLSIAHLTDIAVPIHVEEQGARQALVCVLLQDGIAIEQQIHQVLHDLVEGLVVLTLGDDLELELIDH